MLDVPRVLVAAVLSAVLLAGGCSDAPEEPAGAGRDPEAPRTSRSPEPRTSPTKPTKPTKPTGTSPARPKPSKGVGKIAPTPLPMARPDGSRAHLLTAATLPSAAPGADWTVRGTGPESSRRTGICQEASLVDIGSLHAVIRVFAGPEASGLRSRQLVARFADPKSAWRAHQVLRSWHADCEERLDRPRTDVSPMEDVDVDAGRGGHYRASYGPKKDTDFAGLGIVRSGKWLSLVEISATEGDYPAAWTRRAVRRIAATFTG